MIFTNKPLCGWLGPSVRFSPACWNSSHAEHSIWGRHAPCPRPDLGQNPALLQLPHKRAVTGTDPLPATASPGFDVAFSYHIPVVDKLFRGRSDRGGCQAHLSMASGHKGSHNIHHTLPPNYGLTLSHRALAITGYVPKAFDNVLANLTLALKSVPDQMGYD